MPTTRRRAASSTETVGYFAKDKNLFLVQTPHFFINPDPLERNLGTFQTMPSENEMFYGVIQRGLDKWNAAFFCGSAAVLRREALQETNGFSGVSITEDCETALELHSRGWNERLCGQAADRRPAAGQLRQLHRPALALGAGHDADPALPVSAPQARADAARSASATCRARMFWLFPFSRFCFLVSPLCYLFFSLEIFTASGGEFFAYTFDLHDGELHDAELSLWPLPLAVDLGSLRIHPDDLSACRPCSR